MKKLLLVAAIACAALFALTAPDDAPRATALENSTPPLTASNDTNVPKVLVLDTYDQLQAYVGFDGMIFVRDAAGTHIGQHGDPLVTSGYAMYVWDPLKEGNSKWTLVNKQETMSKVDVLNTKALVNKADYEAGVQSVNAKLADYQEAYRTNLVALTRAMDTIADIHEAYSIDAIAALRSDNARYRASFAMITNSVISETSTFAELKAAVTNIMAAASFALSTNAFESVATP